MLNAVPFLRPLDQGAMLDLADDLHRRPFARNETIIRQGEAGSTFYLMFKGRVGVYRSTFLRKRQVATLGPGEFFGEIALIDVVPRTATVIGLEDGEMFTLD